MEVVVKGFDELTARELFELYKLRVSVFVVEQECPYQEVDDLDLVAQHVWLWDQEQGRIMAYARVLPAGSAFPSAGIGRVIAAERRRGLGTQILDQAVAVARDRLGADCITLEAQTYARGLYEKAGFVQTSDEFLEDGIPHIQMQLQL
ncbi:MAG: GNAT family N-acetyltransferase [Coriobacteriia bacterium]|nr:GNAT family N-acetyltransferase [Coriobacteriia bacterium]